MAVHAVQRDAQQEILKCSNPLSEEPLEEHNVGADSTVNIHCC